MQSVKKHLGVPLNSQNPDFWVPMCNSSMVPKARRNDLVVKTVDEFLPWNRKVHRCPKCLEEVKGWLNK